MRRTYYGSCHCGAVRFEADIDFDEGIRKCNCSFCWKTGYRKALIPFDALRIVQGEQSLHDYRPEPSAWPPGDVDHYCCPTCCTHPFSRGYLEKEMGGEFWAVNVACLDDVDEETLAAAPTIYEDGKRDRQDRAPDITGYL
ncbi:GFA family protein [Luteimonas suaedae]|uniref:GFA family protein n=1 Tax=Luteimonas suaedae TaxID=2605430 RepID=UPI0011EE5B0A|nr:GFA family protein [Luteimonas suaedae]